MLNYREAWGCISCAISSSFFFCAESALLFWSKAEDQPSISLRTISPRSRYPIYCLFLPITKTAKTAPKEQKSSFYFICVCVVPGTHILMYLCLWKGFTPCFFFRVHFAHICGLCCCLSWRQIGYHQIPELWFRLETAIQVRFLYMCTCVHVYLWVRVFECEQDGYTMYYLIYLLCLGFLLCSPFMLAESEHFV